MILIERNEMKIDFGQAIVNYAGVQLHVDGDPVTLRSVCCTALTATIPDEKISGMDKVGRFTLAQRIFSAESPDLTVEEISLIKRLLDSTYATVIVGPAWLLLDPSAS